VPAKRVLEFIAYAKANPGRINMASAGIGSGNHFAGELFKMMTGVNLVHVPYRGGGPALVDMLGGQVQVMFVPMSSSLEYVRTGKLRALAATTATAIPTVAEFVAGYEFSFWTGMDAPKNTPVEIIAKLNEGINAALADPKIKARLADLGGTPFPGSAGDFGKFIAAETEKWGKVIRAANIKPGVSPQYSCPYTAGQTWGSRPAMHRRSSSARSEARMIARTQAETRCGPWGAADWRGVPNGRLAKHSGRI
jgi:tripartite-type tricarboxylate transporter receptor subunit TctC